MSHWNHRIIRKTFPNGDVFLGVVEAFCDDNGLVWAVTDNFQEPVIIETDNETIDNLKEVIGRMLAACDKPILEFDKIPEPGAKAPSWTNQDSDDSVD